MPTVASAEVGSSVVPILPVLSPRTSPLAEATGDKPRLCSFVAHRSSLRCPPGEPIPSLESILVAIVGATLAVAPGRGKPRPYSVFAVKIGEN